MKLFDYLTAHNIPANEFADRVGTTAATISRVANGQVMPRKALMAAILRETDGEVTPNDLFGLPDRADTIKSKGISR